MTQRYGRATAHEKRKALREVIAAPEVGMFPGVFDGYSAGLVEKKGFPGALISGAGLANARVARPDIGIMGLEENLAACRALCSATDIPLIADGDTGYGNAVNVYYATEAFESTGVAAVFFEDQTFPKRCGHMRGKALIPADEMVGKILAATDARQDDQLVIMARTDAATPDDIDEAIYRANLYFEAGADVVFPDAIRSRGDIERFVAAAKGPVCINMGFGLRSRGTTPLMSQAELETYGVAIVIYARLMSSSALNGMTLALDALLEQRDTAVVTERPDLCASFDELEGLVGLEEANALGETYAEGGARVVEVMSQGSAPGPGLTDGRSANASS